MRSISWTFPATERPPVAMPREQASSENVEVPSPGGSLLSTLHAGDAFMGPSEERAKVQPREMTRQEEAELLPEINAVANVSRACSRMGPDEFERYRGRFFAWGPDGNHIIAQAKERELLFQQLGELDVDQTLCVVQFVDDCPTRV